MILDKTEQVSRRHVIPLVVTSRTVGLLIFYKIKSRFNLDKSLWQLYNTPLWPSCLLKDPDKNVRDANYSDLLSVYGTTHQCHINPNWGFPKDLPNLPNLHMKYKRKNSKGTTGLTKILARLDNLGKLGILVFLPAQIEFWKPQMLSKTKILMNSICGWHHR